MPRKDLTLKNKIVILDEIKRQPSNTSFRDLAEIINVPKTTISRLLKNEKQLRDEWMSHKEKPGTSKRKREGKDPDVEEALDQWFSAVTQRGVSISGLILKAKAEELAKKFDHCDFVATDGWLSRWKTRHNIKFKKLHGEKSSADSQSAEKWKNTKVPIYLSTYSPDEIYNADETGLYYRATPDGSLCYKHIALSGFKKAMDRITILCCSNMTGSDKQKLLIIGKSNKPRCFKGLRIESLPVEYHANKNAWMTSEIFRSWLTTWDKKLQIKQRKILLLVDNCAAHPHLDNLKNIQLEFLPANTTSLVQPMDMGIIQNLKTLYRGKLVNYILESIDGNIFTIASTAREISGKINIFQAIQFITDSWRALKTNTIQNCFGYCGLKSIEISEPSDEVIEISQVNNYIEFLSIDTSLPCYDENGDFEDAIVEQIKSKHQTLEEPDDSDDEELLPVTNREAKQCVDTLQRYFMQDGNDGSPMSALHICTDFVQLQSSKNKRQTTLNEFVQF